MCSLPRKAWTIGAWSAAASETTASWAPAVPAPARMVTRLAPLSSVAAASSSLSSGRTTGSDGATKRGVSPSISSSETSPGNTSTATPRCPMAVRIARCSRAGICFGLVTISQKWLHSRNSSVGCVSWK